MKSFIEFAKEQQWELPPVDENVRRAGFGPQYPAAYAGRGLYPDQHWTPHAADAPIKLDLAKQVKDKAPADEAP